MLLEMLQPIPNGEQDGQVESRVGSGAAALGHHEKPICAGHGQWHTPPSGAESKSSADQVPVLQARLQRGHDPLGHQHSYQQMDINHKKKTSQSLAHVRQLHKNQLIQKKT
uniref:Uncharacterized protein n=1 Tax=Eutreptiella gymnastica TaxID=73025 RepID=A0A7S4CVS9_9EUGL